MGALASRIKAVIWSGVLAFLILAFAAGSWGALLIVNLKTSPAIPWAVIVMAVLLWAMWQYLGGKWWPRSSSEARHKLLRANPVSGRIYAWTLVAGVLSLPALAGLWIVFFQLVKMPPNALASMSDYPLPTIILTLVMASLVAPFSEEAAFRGYCQVILERELGGPAAVLISSVFFALAHLTHGLLWPKLLVYFLVGLAFGVPAYLTKSTLPAIPIHILGDLTFFTLVWPRDAARRLVTEGGADMWFWIHGAQIVVFTPLAILGFRQLAKVAICERMRRGDS